jgi:serine/threonine-protein kinase
MGDVYRAKDSKLKRDVALKVLPAAVANDRERLARFQREAEVLASLNHPNIAHIHGIEDADGVTALVMELVEGEDLSQRLARGAIPLDEALPIAKQIADALETAHEQGIIHRDLKPANIKVRPDGTVKVLDFGLAKAIKPGSGIRGPGSERLDNSPTVTSPAMTMQGVILGTAAYMSPEQAKGKPVDRRSDIWAFGCVLYEMLTGTRAFKGDDVTDIITSVMRDTPDWSALPAATPAGLRGLLARCLVRDPKLRLRDIGEARIALTDVDAASDHSLGSAPPPRRTLPRAALIAGAAMLVVVTTGTGWYWGSSNAAAPPTSVPPYRSEIVPVPQDAFDRRSTSAIFTFTPDGGTLIYASGDPASRLLYRRNRESHVAVPITGTEGGYGPFVSPDGGSVGFFADGAMKRVPLAGGAAQVIHNMRAPGAPDTLGFGWTTELGPGRELGLGAAWLSDDTVVYGRFFGGLWRTSATGGTPTAVTKTGEGEIAHRLPRALPGGRAILCTVVRDLIATEHSSVEAVDLATGARTRLVDDATDGRYVAGGVLLFARRGTLYSVRFDASSLTVSGEPVQVSDDVMHAVGGGNPGRSSGAAQYDVSSDGMLAVIGGGMNAQVSRLVAWVERGGKIVPVSSEPAGNLGPRLSPDGTRIALRKAPDIVIMNVLDGIATPLFKNALFPVWSHDGTRVMVANRGANSQEIHGVPLSGGAPEVIVAAANPLWPSSVSRDGRLLAYVESSPVTGNDIWVVGLSPKTAPIAVVATAASEGYPMLSPDGAWLTYAVEEGDSNGVYVRPFPGPGRVERIAGAGSTAPIWTRDGRAIFYGRLTETGGAIREIVRVSIETAGDRLRIGPPVTFAKGEFNRSTPVSNFDITADGSRILTTVDAAPVGGATSPASARRTLQLTYPQSVSSSRRTQPPTRSLSQ